MKGVDQGPGIIIPEKNCACCVTWETLCRWDPEGHTRSCKLCQQLKKPCQRFKELKEKGKWRAEDKGEGAGLSKRPRVGPSLEQMERRQMEVKDPQVGSQVVEALLALNAHLGEIWAKLVAGQEAASESMRLLCCSVIFNLRRIEMTLAVQGIRVGRRGNQRSKGWGRLRSRENRRKSRRSEQSKWRELVKEMNIFRIKNFLVLKVITKRLKRKRGLACLGLQDESPPQTPLRA